METAFKITSEHKLAIRQAQPGLLPVSTTSQGPGTGGQYTFSGVITNSVTLLFRMSPS